MAAPDLQLVLRLPGRLILTPTSFAIGTTIPYGGTYLGYARGMSTAWRRRSFPVIAEEWGTVVETLVCREAMRMVGVIRQYDPDALGLVFQKATGAASGSPVFQAPTRFGYFATAVKLLYAPFDQTAPAVYFQRALPQVDETAELNKALDKDSEYGVVFDCGWSAAGSTPPWQIGPVWDLTV
jgi:hypothetical protein